MRGTRTQALEAIERLAARQLHRLPSFRAALAAMRPGVMRATNPSAETHGSGVGDPVGEAVASVSTGADRASQIEAEYDAHIETAWQHLVQAAKLNDDIAPIDPGPAPSSSSKWCRLCLTHAGECRDIDRRYAGKQLCRWCGDFETIYEMDPPATLVRKHIAKKNITKDDIKRVVPAARLKAASRPKAKGRRRSR